MIHMLQLSHIYKAFGGVKALRDVSLDVKPGEIHALLGENGAGKSTLMKVITGAHRADEGTFFFGGDEVTRNNPQLAKARGIRIIYQEFSLVPALSVTENIFLGSPQTRGWLNMQSLHRKAQSIIHSLGFQLDVRQKVEALSVAQQQVVEIAKAMSEEVKLLILDEPSAVLGPEEVKQLFDLLRQLREQGVGIIYISHHLDELLELSDRITVLKDGQSVTTVHTAKVTKDHLVQLMVGREIEQLYPSKSQRLIRDEELILENLRGLKPEHPITLRMKKGEILGIGGLVGAGRTELLEATYGVTARRSGAGHARSRKRPMGWGMVPEDRKRYGGLLDQSIRDNISLSNLKSVANRWGFIDEKKEEERVQKLVEKLSIKFGHLQDPLSTLSGGNQQKVVLAKWLNVDLQVLLIDEPTRGVDVGARAEIYQIIQDLANQGIYILMVSSDMEELMGLSDRILVMRQGLVQGHLERSEFSEEKIVRLAIGAD